MTSPGKFRIASGVLAGLVTFAAMTPPAGAQLAIKRSPSGFNLFTVDEDIGLGRQSAAEIERLMHLVTNARAERFLDSVLARLTAHAPGPRYPYRVRAVNSKEASAFALPGGPLYVTTGLMGLARSEAELAGLLAHSVAHVVLRHGTERASKAWVARAGVGALGGLGSGPGRPTRIANAVGGLGPEAAFLRFGPSDEFEADALGAELLSQAGYDPVALSAVVSSLRREGRRNPELKGLASSHPFAAGREDRIRNLLNVLGHNGASELVGGFSSVRWIGRATVPPTPHWKAAAGVVAIDSTPVSTDLPAPSSRIARYNHPDAFLSIEYPDNWQAEADGFAISFAPPGGVVQRPSGEPHLVLGAVVNFYAAFESDVERWNNSLVQHYAPFVDRTRSRGLLEDATDDLVRQILSASPYLSAPTGSARTEGSRGYSVRLSGRSPVTGEVERITVYTRSLPDEHVVYLACIAPAKTATAVERACSRMIQSLRVNDAAAHRQQQ